jgi:hypothetical protein
MKEFCGTRQNSYPDGRRIIVCEHKSTVTGHSADMHCVKPDGCFIPRFPEGNTQIAKHLCELKEAAAKRLRECKNE